jgi:DNA repair protein RecO
MMEVRAGEKRSFSALVLASIVYEDHHKIVELFTRECGRISCIARHAVKSRKRFGGALEPMQLVTAHLRTPRYLAEGSSQLWELESVDLNDAFSHLRRSLPWIHAASFVVSSVRELLPEQVVDVPMFRSLGRWLLEIRNLPAESNDSDAWVLLWLEWLSRHLGHGALLEGHQHAELQWIQN